MDSGDGSNRAALGAAVLRAYMSFRHSAGSVL
jgi:hypothetical protein